MEALHRQRFPLLALLPRLTALLPPLRVMVALPVVVEVVAVEEAENPRYQMSGWALVICRSQCERDQPGDRYRRPRLVDRSGLTILAPLPSGSGASFLLFTRAAGALCLLFSSV